MASSYRPARYGLGVADARGHTPVLLDEVLSLLDPTPGETYADCTAGLGGHAASIAPILGPAGVVVLNDLDRANLEEAARRVRLAAAPAPPRVETIHGSFAGLLRELERRGICADTVLADLGFSSTHVDEAPRGFSFQADAPLDMRYDRSNPVSAADLVAGLSEGELAELIRDYGEDRQARAIARKLVEARRAEPITTTGQLARVVRSASGRARGDGIDPATRTFQALRIAVNDEIGSLQALLASIERAAVRRGSGPLAPGARIAIISFHSLEDRPVKQAFQRLVDGGLAERLTARPARASARELSDNPRARSAKLRAIRLASGSGG
jgi:16S rRNA (cytosine1402-N4)-methyltransferase